MTPPDDRTDPFPTLRASTEDRPAQEGEITRIIRENTNASEAILPLVYDELRRIARQRMSRERSDHTLQATALVHEAYGKLLGDETPAFDDRRAFYAAAAKAMQRVLIDHARKAKSQKRGGDALRVTLGAPDAPVALEPERLLALDDALDTLAAEDERAAEVTRLRFVVGLTVEETARTLDISERSVAREWSYARARLMDLLGEGRDS